MTNYTLDEIIEELNKEIEILEEKDPFWKKCRKCPFKGKCCIDNDIDIREDEWKRIENLLNSNPSIYDQVKSNFLNKKKCYFRTETCCLIHDIRPTNCIYTPYQAIITQYENHLIYNKPDDFCNFDLINTSVKIDNDKSFLIKIPNDEHTYLLLNYWVEKFENQSIDCYKMLGEDRLKEYFSNKEKHLQLD